MNCFESFERSLDPWWYSNTFHGGSPVSDAASGALESPMLSRYSPATMASVPSLSVRLSAVAAARIVTLACERQERDTACSWHSLQPAPKLAYTSVEIRHCTRRASVWGRQTEAPAATTGRRSKPTSFWIGASLWLEETKHSTVKPLATCARAHEHCQPRTLPTLKCNALHGTRMY